MTDSTSMQLVEYPDAAAFVAGVGEWLMAREAENSHFLGVLPRIMPMPPGVTADFHALINPRTGVVGAAAVRFGNGCLYVSPMAGDDMHIFISKLRSIGVNLKSVYGPACLEFAALWAGQTGQTCTCARAELLYRITRVATPAPAPGMLVRAVASEHALATRWLHSFAAEANLVHDNVPDLAAGLIAAGELYFWKNPEPVAMAAWVAPTPRGGTINLVYTPAALRSRGHGRAVVSALAQRMLGSGLDFCMVLADPANQRTDRLYRKVGAQPLCEMQRCPFSAVEAGVPVS